MNRNNNKIDYTNPMCHIIDMCMSGILCSSEEMNFSNEQFEGVIDYGKDGWI